MVKVSLSIGPRYTGDGVRRKCKKKLPNNTSPGNKKKGEWKVVGECVVIEERFLQVLVSDINIYKLVG